MQATLGYAYNWSPESTLTDSSIANPLATPDTTTLYTILATDSFGCMANDTVLLTVINIDLVITGDTSICEGESVQLTATGGLTYSWVPAGSLDNSNSATPIASPSQTTTYVVTAETILGCQKSDTITVTVIIFNATTSNDVTICLGDSVQIYASGGQLYVWSPVTGLNDPNIANPVAKPTTTTTYRVTITDAVCSTIDSLVVTV